MALGGLGDLGIDIAGEDFAVRFQGKRNRQRAVTGIGADLKIAPNTEEACEQGHEVRLFGRKQHVNTGQLGGFLADALQCRMFAKADLAGGTHAAGRSVRAFAGSWLLTRGWRVWEAFRWPARRIAGFRRIGVKGIG